MSPEAEGMEAMEPEPDEESVLPATATKTRLGLPKKVTRSKKPLTDFDYMTTLKGFDPYTFKGA